MRDGGRDPGRSVRFFPFTTDNDIAELLEVRTAYRTVVHPYTSTKALSHSESVAPLTLPLIIGIAVLNFVHDLRKNRQVLIFGQNSG